MAGSLDRSPIPIPSRFHRVQFNSACHPGAPGLRGLDTGANCEHFALELVRDFGCIVPDFRSRELWEDTTHTQRVTALEPLDLILVAKEADPFGAHVGVYLGKRLVIHLSERVGVPAIESLEDLNNRPEYKYYIGAKRCRTRRPPS